MALVTRIIGDCPSCGRKDGYGNVNVTRDTLNRGCLSCNHSTRIPLPELNKKVVYLDQFFYSHAFHGGHPLFKEAKDRIQQLARKQVLVAPYCNIHEDETQLCKPEQREPLWKFIKQASAGHDFCPEYKVKDDQLHRAFQVFLRGEPPDHRIQPDDALPGDLNDWDDYFWIDVAKPAADVNRLREAKAASVKSLLELLPIWKTKPSTFDADVRAELASVGDSYLKLYAEYMRRMIEGDADAFLYSPIDSMVVEKLMHYGAKHLTPPLRIQRIRAFFESDHFANVPVERISSELFAMLRLLVREGAFASQEKALKHCKGYFYDVRFISTYAPYCDAMVVDKLMHRLATHPLIDLPKRFGTKFFSRRNWSDFLAYLDGIRRDVDPEIEHAMKLIHPPNAKAPDWSGILNKMR